MPDAKSDKAHENNKQLMKKRMGRLIDQIVRAKRNKDQAREANLERGQQYRRQRMEELQEKTRVAVHRLKAASEALSTLPKDERPRYLVPNTKAGTRVAPKVHQSAPVAAYTTLENPDLVQDAYFGYLVKNGAAQQEVEQALAQRALHPGLSRSQLIAELVARSSSSRLGGDQLKFVVKLLSQVPSLRLLPPRLLEAVAHVTSAVPYRAGERIFRQGDSSLYLAHIIDGVVTMETHNADRAAVVSAIVGPAPPTTAGASTPSAHTTQRFGDGRTLNHDFWTFGRPDTTTGGQPTASRAWVFAPTASLAQVTAQATSPTSSTPVGPLKVHIQAGTTMSPWCLFESAPRPGTAVASAGTVLLTLSRAAFWDAIREADASQLEHKTSVLRGFPLFVDYSHTAISRLAQSCVEVHFAKGQVIVQRGEVSRCVWFVVQGECREVVYAPRASSAAPGAPPRPYTAIVPTISSSEQRVPPASERFDDGPHHEPAPPAMLQSSITPRGLASHSLALRPIVILGPGEYFGHMETSTHIVAHSNAVLLMMSLTEFKNKMGKGAVALVATNTDAARQSWRQQHASVTGTAVEQVVGVPLDPAQEVAVAQAPKVRQRPSTAPPTSSPPKVPHVPSLTVLVQGTTKPTSFQGINTQRLAPLTKFAHPRVVKHSRRKRKAIPGSTRPHSASAILAYDASWPALMQSDVERPEVDEYASSDEDSSPRHLVPSSMSSPNLRALLLSAAGGRDDDAKEQQEEFHVVGDSFSTLKNRLLSAKSLSDLFVNVPEPPPVRVASAPPRPTLVVDQAAEIAAERALAAELASLNLELARKAHPPPVVRHIDTDTEADLQQAILQLDMQLATKGQRPTSSE